MMLQTNRIRIEQGRLLLAHIVLFWAHLANDANMMYGSLSNDRLPIAMELVLLVLAEHGFDVVHTIVTATLIKGVRLKSAIRVHRTLRLIAVTKLWLTNMPNPRGRGRATDRSREDEPNHWG
jgi:hypothetical protein